MTKNSQFLSNLYLNFQYGATVVYTVHGNNCCVATLDLIELEEKLELV